MGLSYLSNQYWLPDSTESDCMLQQSLELPQELELDLDHFICFQDDFTLADTSIDPLFHHPQPQSQPIFISQSQPPQLPTTTTYHHLDHVQQDFQQQQQQQQCYYSTKRQKTTPQYFNINLHDEDMLSCTNVDPFYDSQVVNQSSDEAWMLPDVTFPPVFTCGSNASNNNNYRSGRRVGGLSAQSIAARQRRRKIADKTQELGKLIPGGHKMNTADMFHSASMYVKYLQAQISILTLTNNSLQEESSSYDEEQQHLKTLVVSRMVQEKLYSQEKCLAPQKLVKYLSKDSKLQYDHPYVFQQVNTLLMTTSTQGRH